MCSCSKLPWPFVVFCGLIQVLELFFFFFVFCISVKDAIGILIGITMSLIDGETMKTVRDFIFMGSKITADGDCSHEIKRRLLLGRKAMTNLDSILKSRDITLSTKVCLVKATIFPVGVQMWELNYKESWAPKNWGFWTVVLDQIHESSLDWKEIQPVNLKGNSSWIFIGRIDAEAETPILWPPDVKNWLTGKCCEKTESRRRRGRMKMR